MILFRGYGEIIVHSACSSPYNQSLYIYKGAVFHVTVQFTRMLHLQRNGRCGDVVRGEAREAVREEVREEVREKVREEVRERGAESPSP